MPRPGLAWRSAAALAIVLSGLSLSRADDDDKDDNGKPETLAEKAADRFPQPVVVGTLIHRAVLEPLESQPILGYVQELVRTRDGSTDVVIDYGGWFGFGTRPIAVPIDGMVLSGQFMEIVDFSPAELQKFSTFKGVDVTSVTPETVIKVGLAKPSH